MTATIVGDNGSGTYAWSGTGIAGSTFNPSGLDPGIVVVSLNYTGVNLGIFHQMASHLHILAVFNLIQFRLQ
ncbi:MAG: hypothetical protein IPO48_13285 [Saprospiraceae bacterium]|nr:hypothetical protein [Saprospiraceae bacterium]